MKAFLAVFLLFLAQTAHAATAATPWKVVTPAGFEDATSSGLFQTVQEQYDARGRPLHLYLPQKLFQHYQEGRADLVTRQVLLYTLEEKEEKYEWNRRSIMLLADCLEGAFAGFEKVSGEAEARARLYRHHTERGRNVLVDKGETDNAFYFLVLLAYPTAVGTGPTGENRPLVTALCTSLVFPGKMPVFVTASSIVTDGNPSAHLEWVRNAADTFANMLVSTNKPEGK